MKHRAWAKTTRNQSGATHPLAHHSMDVAATFLRMTRLPVIRNRLDTAAGKPLTEHQCWLLAALVFLHDIGKLHPGFQAKKWPTETCPGPRRGHLKEGWAFFHLAHQLPEHPFHDTMLEMVTWFPSPTHAQSLFAALIAHHGSPVPAPTSIAPTLAGDWDRTAPAPPDYDWRSETRVMDSMLRRWFQQAFKKPCPQLPDSPSFYHCFAGFLALSDWIGSDTRFFSFTAPFDPEYDQIAHRHASRALAEIGLDLLSLAEHHAPGFRQLTTFPVPNPSQSCVGSIHADARLLILEAETGSGKTEAALWRFTQLLTAGQVSGLYFAVPTRAAARQLHDRITRGIKRAYGGNAPEPVLAIPGMLRAGDHDGHRLPGWEVRWDDDDDPTEHRSRWSAEHATRFLSSPIAIGTVDQAMLAGLPVKHAHMRGSSLSRSLLVVDEVHASDAYMTVIQQQLLRDHLDAGGYAMLMSATLGSCARVRWTAEPQPDFEAACATPYPAIWIGGEAVPRAPVPSKRSRTVHVEAMPSMDPEHTALYAMTAAKSGARILIIRNTVAMAAATWRAVRDAGGVHLLLQAGNGPALHHGRFAVEDRELLDRAVEEALSRKRQQSGPGCIVIGTQTLEQSLDIDADHLLSDLCPMDVLLQRIGRLHRHDLPKQARPPEFRQAKACILMPADGLDPLAASPFRAKNGLGAWERDGGFDGIYRDLAALELTRRAVLERPTWHIPDMNRSLVEGVTHPEPISELIAEKGDLWETYHRKAGGSRFAEESLARLNRLDRSTHFACLCFPGQDERIMTRLGDEALVVSLDPPPIGPYGLPVSRISLPARWSLGISKEQPARTSLSDNALLISIGDRCFQYSREGLMKAE